MPFDKKYTIQEFVNAVLSIDNERDANAFVEHYLELIEEPNIEDRLRIMRLNIGYCFGEGMSSDKIMMWMKVAKARHPWFDPLENPSPDELLRIGRQLANEIKNKS